MRRLDWDWEDAEASGTSLEAAARSVLAQHPRVRFSVVWAAGRSGFAADRAVMDRELAALSAVLNVARVIGKGLPQEHRAVHLVSSAGGLFEGKTAVDRATAPNPLRPYGVGKVEQEHLVFADQSLGVKRVYRPSSVYGYVRGARNSLISELLAGAQQARPVRIIGALTTQRDYVFNRDIGRFIANEILYPGSDEVKTHLLASGRPADIFQIIQLIEYQTRTCLYREIDPKPSNALDNTIFSTALPSDFRPTTLIEGISQTALAMGQDGISAAFA